MQGFWNKVFYEPLYNILIVFVAFVPGHSMAVSIILLTLLVKVVLFPLAKKSIRSQFEMKLIEGDLKEIKKSGLSKEEQAKKTFELYKEKGVNPFSGCLPLIIQLPIIIALYSVFIKGVDGGYLYSFVSSPDYINQTLFGLKDLGEKSVVLAILAGISQYFQARVIQKFNPNKGNEKSILDNTQDFSESLATSMNFQMKYVFPVMVAIFAYTINAAVALYWVVSNIFTVAQEFVVRRELEKKYNNIK